MIRYFYCMLCYGVELRLSMIAIGRQYNQDAIEGLVHCTLVQR